MRIKGDARSAGTVQIPAGEPCRGLSPLRLGYLLRHALVGEQTQQVVHAIPPGDVLLGKIRIDQRSQQRRAVLRRQVRQRGGRRERDVRPVMQSQQPEEPPGG
jgi:hypothetical protein